MDGDDLLDAPGSDVLEAELDGVEPLVDVLEEAVLSSEESVASIENARHHSGHHPLVLLASRI